MTQSLAILTALDNVGAYLLPEQALHVDVCALLPAGAQAPTLSDLRRALGRLEALRQVVGVTDDEERTLWKITAAGRARLAEAR